MNKHIEKYQKGKDAVYHDMVKMDPIHKWLKLGVQALQNWIPV